MPSENSILVVDDEEGIRIGLSRFFRREGFETATAADADEALRILNGGDFCAVILDVRLGGESDGPKLLGELRARFPELPVIVITGYGSVESAVQAMKDGAADYILKPIDNAHLLETVRRSIELLGLRRDNAYLRRELITKLYSHDIITGDPQYRAVIERADRVKDSNATILLTGESGTGKEVMARYVHFTGNRRDGPFVDVNCAALSESLLLSELFGHERGSFTGAVEKRRGKFEIAHNGTLFLDEIGDMPLDAQSKLLRVLEESSFERVGGSKKISVDIRVIAATNKNLQELMARGEFRSDLFYRINIVTLRLPPLRERRDDIPLLADHFVRKYAKAYNKPVPRVSAEVLDAWRNAEWPGNVRQLQNEVNQAVLLCRETVIDGPVAPCRAASPAEAPRAADGGFDPDSFPDFKSLRDAAAAHYERRLIARTLESQGGNKTRTASALGITRKTLADKMLELGIEGADRIPRAE